MSMIYEPSDDTFLFVKFLNDYFKNKDVYGKSLLDMGCGNCLLSDTMRDLRFENILCVDINDDAVAFAGTKKFRSVKSNLFENVLEKFDYILFNPPYLPEDCREDEESKLITCGGKRGDELILKFLEDASKHLNKNGEVFVLMSNMTPLDRIKKYKFKIMVKEKLFFEEIFVAKFELDI